MKKAIQKTKEEAVLKYAAQVLQNIMFNKSPDDLTRARDLGRNFDFDINTKESVYTASSSEEITEDKRIYELRKRNPNVNREYQVAAAFTTVLGFATYGMAKLLEK